uniref:Uncharacterized protein n=1 Tax=Hyaloperonospora arabidopsidis (strain Emoy2) TaxID=559515 RepID=M4B2U0_HYAAE
MSRRATGKSTFQIHAGVHAQSLRLLRKKRKSYGETTPTMMTTTLSASLCGGPLRHRSYPHRPMRFVCRQCHRHPLPAARYPGSRARSSLLRMELIG